MRTKLLFYSAIGFFILGYKSQDSLLYFFFAVYLFSLSVCFYLYSRENRLRKTDSDLVEDSDGD
jgi:hypothetical protein